jgi:hypothetical protein
MTTPGNGSTGNVTQNEINATQNGQQAFEEAVNALNTIVSSVLDSNTQLTTSAMVSQAGAKFGSAVEQWLDDFNDLRGVTQWMGEQLGTTWRQMVQNEQNNTDLAAGLQNPVSAPTLGSFNS